MRSRINLVLVALIAVIAGLYGLQSSGASGLADSGTQNKNLTALVANGPVQAMLRTKTESLSIKGNLSLYLETSPEQLKAGSAGVRQINLAFTGVKQSALSGRESKVRQGVLGMSRPSTSFASKLRYDVKTQTLSGEIPVNVYFSQLDELIPQEMVRGGKEADFAVPRTQRGSVKLEIKFSEALDKSVSQAASGEKQARVGGDVKATVDTEPMQDNRLTVAPYTLDLSSARQSFVVGVLRRFEVASRLCIQPIRIRSSAADASPTGAGMAFGMPGANTQWNKADLVFQVREWMTVTNSSLKVATSGAEETTIRGSVNVDDCIEVFFIENFDPVSLHGGGATWSSGTADAKIISSDGNAAGGIDLTHLAHELGHVVGMGHPGNPNGLYDASTNTLMCPSGWLRDNPRRNSANNASHLSNPLLTLSLKPISVGTDCTANADCGACPF